jgi:hypothetical protein
LPDKRDIVVDQIRELKKDVIVVPNDSAKKAYVINSADLMNRNAQNAFLQTLEEPPAHAVFILRTENPAALLPTVRSRCVELKAPSDTETPDATTEEMAGELFAAMKQGNVRLAAFMFRLEKLERDEFAGFLSAARVLAAEKLRPDSPDAACTPRLAIARTERLLVRAGEMLDLNVSTGHISGMICANLLRVES